MHHSNCGTPLSGDFSDNNYYNNYYAYDDHLRPFSASSNSCSSSNSESDSPQMQQHHPIANSNGATNGMQNPTSGNYSDCLRPQHTFELNCFNSIAAMDGAVTNQVHEDLSANYRPNGHHGVADGRNGDHHPSSIHYTSVIVEPTTFHHISNDFVH